MAIVMSVASSRTMPNGNHEKHPNVHGKHHVEHDRDHKNKMEQDLLLAEALNEPEATDIDMTETGNSTTMFHRRRQQQQQQLHPKPIKSPLHKLPVSPSSTTKTSRGGFHFWFQRCRLAGKRIGTNTNNHSTTTSTSTCSITHSSPSLRGVVGKKYRFMERRPFAIVVSSLIVTVLTVTCLVGHYNSNSTTYDKNSHIPWLPHEDFQNDLPRILQQRQPQRQHDQVENHTTILKTSSSSSSSSYWFPHFFYYYEQQQQQQHEEPPNAVSVDDYESPLIHIVNSRFMQEQGDLYELAMARLALFQTVCLPSMIHQSTTNFFWIFKTDPHLDPSILQTLVDAFAPHSNFYLVASNANYLITTSTSTTTTTTTSQAGTMVTRLLRKLFPTPHDDNKIMVDNHPSTGRAWRDGGEGWDLLQSRIYTGNLTKLYQAMALRQELPILETRLDADDGLHQYYLEYVQAVAQKRFQIPTTVAVSNKVVGGGGGKQSNRTQVLEMGQDLQQQPAPKQVQGGRPLGQEHKWSQVEEESSSWIGTPKLAWLYWCSRRHLEWHIGVEENDTETTNTTTTSSQTARSMEKFHDLYPHGILNPVEHSKMCITPGMTVGYNVGTDPKTVPVHPHDQLYKKLIHARDCYNQNPQEEKEEEEDTTMVLQKEKEESHSSSSKSLSCLELVDDLLFCAIRSRTFTSAGMRHVLLEQKFIPKRTLHAKLWTLASQRFRFNETTAQATKDYLIQHGAAIALDNLKGQCTTGHSCKKQAQEALHAYLGGGG
jgi:hypothetical protein